MGGLHRSWKLPIDVAGSRSLLWILWKQWTSMSELSHTKQQLSVISFIGRLECWRQQAAVAEYKHHNAAAQHNTAPGISAAWHRCWDCNVSASVSSCPQMPSVVCPRCLASVSTLSGPGPGWHHITSAAPPSQPQQQHIPLLQCLADKYRTSC